MRSTILVSASLVAFLGSTAEAWVLLPSSPKNAVGGLNTNRTVWPFASKCWKTLNGLPTEFAAHRGSRWHLPEHTAGAYWEGALNSPEFNEPDLVFSKDGEIMVNHDSFLDGTTDSMSDAAGRPSFANKTSTKHFWAEDMFENKTALWAADLTAAEIKELNVMQSTKHAYRPHFYDRLFQILTFDEFIEVNKNISATVGHALGFIPEIKQPFFQNTVVLNPELDGKHPYPFFGGSNALYPHTAEEKVVAALKKHGLPSAQHPVLIQSFEFESIEYLANKYPNGTAFTGLVMLVDKNWWILTPKGMDTLAALSKKTNTPIYISPWKDAFTDGEPLYIVQETGDDIYSGKGDFQYPGYNPKDVMPPAEIVGAAHARGLRMTSYTSYSAFQGLGFYCQESLPKGYDTSKLPYKTVPCPKTKRAEFFYLFDLGMDQMFVEDVQEAQQLREEYNMYLITQCVKDDPANLWKHMKDTMIKEKVPNMAC